VEDVAGIAGSSWDIDVPGRIWRAEDVSVGKEDLPRKLVK
jgi:hypothetical protein